MVGFLADSMAAKSSGKTTAYGAHKAALTVRPVGLESLTLLVVGILLLLSILRVLLLLLSILRVLRLLLCVVRSSLALTLTGLRVGIVAAVIAHYEG